MRQLQLPLKVRVVITTANAVMNMRTAKYWGSERVPVIAFAAWVLPFCDVSHYRSEVAILWHPAWRRGAAESSPRAPA